VLSLDIVMVSELAMSHSVLPGIV